MLARNPLNVRIYHTNVLLNVFWHFHSRVSVELINNYYYSQSCPSIEYIYIVYHSKTILRLYSSVSTSNEMLCYIIADCFINEYCYL